MPAAAFTAMLFTPAPTWTGSVSAAGLESILVGVGRAIGLAITGWLLASQLLYTLAVLTQTRQLAETLQPITLPLVRRAVAGLAAVTFGLSSITALAQTTPETTVVTVDHSHLRQEATPTPNLQPLVEVHTEEPRIEQPEGSYSAPLTWLVRPGDHLWKIAGQHLRIVLDRPPTRDEHARYWLEVIEAARPVIRSGDPDLIYPGEEIPLPPTLDAGVRP
ncbi:MAG: LysM peptidoglycan-binding domain-containing protein [Actinomycetota bacterium]